ncbi:MAG: hypothetical protein WCS43_15570 [Verrucomicrobiota bacterium]
MNTKPNFNAGRGCPATASAVLARIEGMGVRKVMASTQYGMGFILVEQGPPDTRGGIAYRNDAMSHAERIQMAEEVNEHLRPNAQGQATGRNTEQP